MIENALLYIISLIVYFIFFLVYLSIHDRESENKIKKVSSVLAIQVLSGFLPAGNLVVQILMFIIVTAIASMILEKSFGETFFTIFIVSLVSGLFLVGCYVVLTGSFPQV